MDPETKKLFRTLGNLSTVGLTMAFSIGIGALIGFYLDRELGTQPWLMLVFLGFGIAAAFRNLYLMYKKLKNQEEGKK
ncbi:MAG: AtpZ/AtpI family protein [Thermodesulfobacteriota bacterium]